MSENGVKVFPPSDKVEPNVFVIVEIPDDIYDDILDYGRKEVIDAVFATAEQELNVHTQFNVSVNVTLKRMESG